ncbi:MAG: hypothetical protein JW882_07240, partial [Deltaproteobacteria bacterium]|nr:hypothetical protein [Deltaproteobacteria bacterium]
TWTALADNPTAINISPDLPSFRNGDGKLLVTLPPSYNSETQPSINTLIRVIDMGGAIHDSQTINVHLGTIVAADINGDGNVDLIDAILALQISSGISGSHGIYNQADVNDDSRIGLGEGVYILQKISGLRQ